METFVEREGGREGEQERERERGGRGGETERQRDRQRLTEQKCVLPGSKNSQASLSLSFSLSLPL